MGLRYRQISPPPVIYGHHPGHSTFFLLLLVEMFGRIAKLGTCISGGGYHSRKTSCKMTFKTHIPGGYTDHKYVFFSLDLICSYFFIMIYRGHFDCDS